MSDFKKAIGKFVTCEVNHRGKVRHFAKLDNGNWSAVFDNGSLDWVEVNPSDFNAMLESVESVGATIRFTNHSAI